MARNEDQKDTRQALKGVEAFWGLTVPPSFETLYSHFEHPFLAPCEFFSLAQIAAGEGREFGMLPRYLPFGKAIGEGGTYGFYLPPPPVGEAGSLPSALPIAYQDEDEGCLRPVASDFEAFLRHCVMVGRYETEDEWLLEDRDPQEETERRTYARLLDIPESLFFGDLPRNDTELYERLLRWDAQDAATLLHLGCVKRWRNEEERALDFFHRAGEAAPWFGDCAYLVGDVYRTQERLDRAVGAYWSVANSLLPLCTSTVEWDLGEDHPEADIYEIATDALSQFQKFAPPAMKADPLWRVVVEQDPYDPEVREEFGHLLLQQDDPAGAEREFLNALSLCAGERGKQPLRLYEALLSVYERCGRSRETALLKHDRSLRR